MVICCKFIKESLQPLTLYTPFHNLITTGQGQTTPGDKILMSTEPLVTSVICFTFQKKISLKSDFILSFFHDFIHVNSPGARADNPLETKF